MIDKTKPISIRLAKGEIDQLQTRAYTLSASVTGVACQIAPKCDPFFAAKNDPFDGAETGSAEPHIAEQSRSWRAASGRLCAVLEAPAFVAGLDDVAVVCQPVKHGGGHFGVAEDLRPICESEIGGDQQRRVLIELADQVEQQLAAGLAER